jgi:hypothetical protein
VESQHTKGRAGRRYLMQDRLSLSQVGRGSWRVRDSPATIPCVPTPRDPDNLRMSVNSVLNGFPLQKITISMEFWGPPNPRCLGWSPHPRPLSKFGRGEYDGLNPAETRSNWLLERTSLRDR